MPETTRSDTANVTFSLLPDDLSAEHNGESESGPELTPGEAGISSEELRARIIDDVFPELATGLLGGHPRRRGRPHSKDVLDALFNDTLNLLFRLLVLLFAEARGLLPVNEEGYYKASLTHLARCARREYASSEGHRARKTSLSEALLTLFTTIRGGNDTLGVRPVESELFKRREAFVFLDHHSIQQKCLRRALVHLTALNPEGNPTGPGIDYRLLEVRALGAIYESLLGRRLVPKGGGEMELAVEQRDRRATGAFYTPQSIVEHMVEAALGSIVDERTAGFEGAMERIAEIRGMNGRVPKSQLDECVQQALDAVLTLRVCDPTMGSGHFLIYAADYLARRFAEVLARYPEHNPVTARLAAFRGEILSDLQRQGIRLQDAGSRLIDEVLLRPFIIARCLYGVDLDPTAAELARLSLWLHASIAGLPLSRIKRHLKVGNALVGASLNDVPNAIGEDLGADIRAIHEAAQHAEGLEPYKRFLDLWTSQYFGNEKARALVRDRAQEVIEAFKAGEDATLKGYAGIVENVWGVGMGKRFFHWELEFPDVFLNIGPEAERNDDCGFDAVIGNPPYVSVRNLINSAPEERAYFVNSGRYVTASHVWDLYMLTTELSVSLLRDGGRSSLIVPVTFLHQRNARDLRRELLRRGAIESVVDLSRTTIFEDALVKTATFVFEKGGDQKHTFVYRPSSVNRLADGSALHYSVAREDLEGDLEAAFRPGLAAGAIDVIRKIRRQSVELTELLYPTFGLRPSPKVKGAGTRDRLLTRNGERPEAKRYVRGRNVSRYSIEWEGEYVLYRPEEMYSGRFEELFEHPKLLVRAVLADKNVIAAVDRSGFYADQTLVCCARPEFVREKANVSAHESAYELEFIAALLNSRLASYYFHIAISGDSLGGGAIHCTPGMTARLPIRRIAFTTPSAERKALFQNLMAHYEEASEEAGHARVATYHETASHRVYDIPAAPVLDLVDMHLRAEPERADVVHDLLAHLAREMARMDEKRQALDLDVVNYVGATSRSELCLTDCGRFELVQGVGSSLLGTTRSEYDGLRIGTLSAEQAGCAVKLFATARYKPRATRYETDAWGYTETEPVDVGILHASSHSEATFLAHWLSTVSDRAGGFASYRRKATKRLSLLDRICAIRLPESAASGEGIACYLESVAMSEVLNRQLAFTDYLIDQIMYRFYGLSEMEIRLVEQSDE